MRYRKPNNNHEALVLALDIFMRVDEDDKDGRSKAYCMLDYFFAGVGIASASMFIHIC